MIKKFLDLGSQPLANSYISKKNLLHKEKKFKLEIGFNKKNYLVSILTTVSKEKMFNKDYPYKSSESFTMRKSFKDLAKKISKIIGYSGKILWDKSKPDGAVRKLLDDSKIKSLGWVNEVDLDQGISITYEWYLDNIR